MNCNHTNVHPSPGDIEECSDCHQFVWRNQDERLFLVPFLKKSDAGIELCSATSHNEAAWFLESQILRTRLNLKLDGLNSEGELPSAVNSVANRNRRFQAIEGALRPFGLMLTRFINDGSLEKNEPFWIHRSDASPQDKFPHLTVHYPNDSGSQDDEEDPRWDVDWRGRLDTAQLMAKDRLYRAWRPGQKTAVKSVLEKRRSMSIVSLPTGRGKSFIAQYCAKLLRQTEGSDQGPTLIISPLISLMDDQRIRWNEINEEWQRHGIEPLRCAFLTSEETMLPAQLKQQLRNGELDVLCCSPEALLRPSSNRVQWIEIFQQMKHPFSLMVIDEAHTIADWGASIRPEFQLLDTIKRILVRKNPACRLLMMSATITKPEEDELNRMFQDGMRVMPTIREIGQSAGQQRSSKTRPDLMFDIEVVPTTSEEQVQEALAASTVEFQRIKDDFGGRQDWWRDEYGVPYNATPFSSVLFTRRRKDAKKPGGNGRSSIHENLNGTVQTYTGETSSVDRQRRLEAFLFDRISCLVATSAFGMGVDKPNAWLAGYLGLPFTLKSLYQSFGRAARDSGWPPLVSNTYRSGICFGRIFGKGMAFSPEMQTKLSLERFWDFVELHDYQDGYMFLDIEQDAGLGWTTSPATNNESKFEFGEDALQDEYGWSEGQTFASNEALKRTEKAWRKKRKSRDAQIHFRMWLLSVLERAGACSIVGVLRNGPQLRAFKTSIVQGQSEGAAFEAASNVDGFPPEKLVLVTRIELEVGGFDHLLELIGEGIDILKKRHDTGLDEIKEFRKKLADPSACRRQLLAPAIGVNSEDELTCIEAFESGLFLMPCNACRRHQTFVNLGLPQEGPLVSTVEVVNLLREQHTITTPAQESRFILPESGVHAVGEMISLVQPVKFMGDITIVEADKSRRKATVLEGGDAIILGPQPADLWSVEQGKYYVERSRGIFVATEDE